MTVAKLHRQSKHEERWSHQAAVGKHNSFVGELNRLGYEEKYNDFSAEYLPYYDESSWSRFSADHKAYLLSYGWLLYNLKTIDIEQSVLTEYCRIVLSRESNFDFTFQFLDRLAQVQIDEAYHTLMSYSGIEMCSRLNGLDIKNIPKTYLSSYINSLSKLSKKSRELALLALTTVCEVTISKYLTAFPKSDSLQPAFRFITETHRRDEISHSALFTDILSIAFENLSENESDELCYYLEESMEVIKKPDLEVWRYINDKFSIDYNLKENKKYQSLFDFYALKKIILKFKDKNLVC